MIKILLATMISISSIGFTNEAMEDWDDELLGSILANENEVVDHYDEDKIYVKPNKIHPTATRDLPQPKRRRIYIRPYFKLR